MSNHRAAHTKERFCQLSPARPLAPSGSWVKPPALWGNRKSQGLEVCQGPFPGKSPAEPLPLVILEFLEQGTELTLQSTWEADRPHFSQSLIPSKGSPRECQGLLAGGAALQPRHRCRTPEGRGFLEQAHSAVWHSGDLCIAHELENPNTFIFKSQFSS